MLIGMLLMAAYNILSFMFGETIDGIRYFDDSAILQIVHVSKMSFPVHL